MKNNIINVTYILIFIILFNFIIGLLLLKSSEQMDYLEILNSQTEDFYDWYPGWGDGSERITIVPVQGEVVIEGKLKNQSWEAIHKNITLDLDEYPFLEIEVKSVSHQWFLIISGNNIKKGYVKIQPDIKKIGIFKYDIKKLLKLKGEINFTLQIGVSVLNKNSCYGASVHIKKLSFFGKASLLKKKYKKKKKTLIDPDNYLDLLGDELYENMSDWYPGWGDGPERITIQTIKKETVIEAKLENQNWEGIHKNITLDLDEYPYLEIDVKSVSDYWFLVISSDKIKQGYIKIQPDTIRIGKIKYNIKKLLGLTGEVNFVLQIGISKPKAKNCAGSKVVLKKLRLLGIKRKIMENPYLDFKYVKRSLKKKKAKSIYLKTISLKNKKNIFSLYNIPKKEKSVVKSKYVYKERGSSLIIENAYYELNLSKHNGAILYIKDKHKDRKISLGTIKSSLWRLEFKDKKILESSQFSHTFSQKNFSYQWLPNQKILKMIYKDIKSGSQIFVYISPSKSNFFDFYWEIKNNFKKPIISATLPQGLSFNINALERFYFPWKIGVYFNRNFFLTKRYISEPYPWLFADFISIESKEGDLSIYMIQKKNNFQQTRLNVGYNSYNNGVGIYEHEFGVYIKQGEKWDSPKLRFCVGSPILQSLSRYVQDNDIDTAPTLKEKTGDMVFKKLSEGVLLKVDFRIAKQTFSETEQFLKTLPPSTIIHLVSFWEKGFDQNYPDYLPPDKKFGSSDDLKKFIKTAQRLGLLVMPYSNPTWWNESPSLRKLGVNNIAVRKLNNSIHKEFYGQNDGIIVSPHHPDAIKKMNQIADQFSKEFQFDIIFEDQLGARPWVYDLNPKSKKPASYTKGIINIAKRDCQKIPVMTEGGFDQLIPYCIGFCDMSAINALPPDPVYNTMWGKDNWEIYPMMLTFLGSKIGIYQHNLAHEVFTDRKDKLTWNLAYGHNLYNIWIPLEWYRKQRWFHIANAVQKNIVSRYFGKNLIHFKKIKSKVTWSRFDDIAILANHDLEKEYSINSHTLAKGGFLAQSKENDVLAGFFTCYNQRPLAKECLIIEKRTDNGIIVQQPTLKNTFISIVRPAKWKKADWVHCYLQNQFVPIAVNSKTITFLFQKSKNITDYQIVYKQPELSNIRLIIQPLKEEVVRGDKVRVKVIAQNNDKTIKNAKIILTGMVVSPGNSRQTIIREDKSKKIIKKLGLLKSGQQIETDFKFEVPSEAQPGDIVWLKASLQYSDNNVQRKKEIRWDLPVINPLQIKYLKNSLTLAPGMEASFDILLKNISRKKIKGIIEVDSKDIPLSWVKSKRKTFYVPGKSKKKVKINISIPFELMKETIKRKGFIITKVKIKDEIIKSERLFLEVVPVLKQVELFPNILLHKEKQRMTVTLRAQNTHSFSGSFHLKVPSKWKLNKKKQAVYLLPGQKKTFDFKVTPNIKGNNKVTIEFIYGRKKFKYSRTVFVINKNEAAIIEGDYNGDTYPDIVIGNNKIEMLITSIIGGRILSLYNRETGHNQLYTDYPGIELTKGDTPGDWVEYGGINDCLPILWPGDIWNNEWDYRVTKRGPKQVAFFMTAKTKNNLTLQRYITLNADSSKVKIDYTIKNNSSQELKFVFANHPDFAPGPKKDADQTHRVIVPIKDKLINKPFGILKAKYHYSPSEGWCVALDSKTGEYFAQIFDKKLVEKIGEWEGTVFYTMELIFKEIELRPGEEKKFTISYIIGKHDWHNKVKKQ